MTILKHFFFIRCCCCFVLLLWIGGGHNKIIHGHKSSTLIPIRAIKILHGSMSNLSLPSPHPPLWLHVDRDWDQSSSPTTIPYRMTPGGCARPRLSSTWERRSGWLVDWTGLEEVKKLMTAEWYLYKHHTFICNIVIIITSTTPTTTTTISWYSRTQVWSGLVWCGVACLLIRGELFKSRHRRRRPAERRTHESCDEWRLNVVPSPLFYFYLCGCRQGRGRQTRLQYECAN